MGQAVVDTGCPFTVAGETWFLSYMETLSRKDRNSIWQQKSKNKFRFGDGNLYRSEYHVTVPIYVGNSKHKLGIDIVKCNIPLLLSRETLKRACATIDVANSMISFAGVNVPLSITSTGHMCLRISRSLDLLDVETQNVLSRVLFTSPLDGVGLDLRNKATKLHLQFCHPSADRLIDLIRKAGTTDDKIFEAIQNVTDQCDVCIRNKKAPLRPVVGFPLATHFNETVAMDLKSRGSDGYLLHMIDHLTRYSAACLIKNKKKETIIKGVMDHWIKVFGCPKYFLSDNGGEFVNHDFIDMAEKFNISLRTTAAESAWSNGLCERHNAILNNNVNKILESGISSLKVAVSWAVAAKNSLTNVYGFSPNTLVFGRNPNFPSAFVNKPPANNLTCLDDYVAENLNAMHIARKAFVQQESAERLRRALSRKSRTYSNITYCQGDIVYYWRNNKSDCHGPAVVIGKDGQQVLLKHGGVYIRVHPCRMQPCQTQTVQPEASKIHTDQDARPSGTDNSENDDDYATAKEDSDDDSEDVIESSTSANPVATGTNEIPVAPENVENPTVAGQLNNNSNGWTHVTSKENLPKVNSTIECMFPEHDWKVKCRVLSKAGKSSTAS